MRLLALESSFCKHDNRNRGLDSVECDHSNKSRIDNVMIIDVSSNCFLGTASIV